MSNWGDDLAIAGSVVVILTGVAVIGAGVRSFWERTFGARRKLARGLNRLAAGIPSESLESLLGPCSLRRQLDGVPTFNQQIYLTKSACVDAIIETATNTVTAFAITVRDRRFRFNTKQLSFGLIDVTLGQTTFAQISGPPGHPWSVRWWDGARDAGYAEHYYLGNPGGYQNYILAHVRTGVGPLAYDQAPKEVRGGYDTGRFAGSQPVVGEPPDGPDWSSFRSGTVVNTLQVLGPGWPPSDELPRPGVHGDIIRVLRQHP
jgi:hypothetical protein